MPLLQLFSTSVEVIYKGKLFSRAAAFTLVCWTANLALPLLVVYRSEGFWRDSETFLEQPDVAYKSEMYLELSLLKPLNASNSAASKLVWSSFGKPASGLEGVILRTPQISVILEPLQLAFMVDLCI